jgi:DNA-binding NtrC family response regulator
MPTFDLDILVVDDEADLRQGLCRLLRSTGARVRDAASAEEALEAVDAAHCDLVVSDIKMRGMSGVELLRELRRRHPAPGVMLMTGFGTIELAVECLQGGALHFLTKPFDNDEIVSVVRRFGERIVSARRTVGSCARHGIVAADRAMLEVLDLVEQVAATRVPVLIEGESGTGKELIARAIHECGGGGGSFIAVNCAAIPETLLESELFGYRRGAFTGAERDHAGVFARADGGTLFLDEVPSMPPAFQAKLLRVLQDKRFQPLGSGETAGTDFRLVTAANRDLRQLVAEGCFREDLFYRMNVLRIALPPLRERRGDIEVLARHFLQRTIDALPDGNMPPELGDDALDELLAHDWPGNVRELENAVQRAVILCREAVLRPVHFRLRENIPGADCSEHIPTQPDSYEEAKQQLLERFQRSYIQRALERTNGNISRAAEECGLTRAAIQKMLRRLNIDRSDFGER